MGAEDFDIYRRQTRSGMSLVSFSGHQAMVVVLAISPGDLMLVSTSHDKRILLWDYQSGKLITTRQTTGTITSLQFCPDSTALALGSHTGDCMVVRLHRKGFLNKGCMLFGHTKLSQCC
eukprot:NODE_1628_length_1351_cov_4.101382_g1348_i0.p2 GENE.NODE_1628_length_1351_cov_4.101382_g1348_i0~~NODE_1628_length_1351_cov_4.101382_g1348_i0.p2  ORF type:complete len:119 (+),score=19.24 NODE_1628_length_1351_cov_4.101382_g1348_i0:292-648(+)